MVAQLASGPCIVMEISTPDFHVETPQKFRAFVGPSDPVSFLHSYSILIYYYKDKYDFLRTWPDNLGQQHCGPDLENLKWKMQFIVQICQKMGF